MVAISLMPNYVVVTLCDIFQQFNGREISGWRISAKQKLHRSPTHFKKRCKITSYHKLQRKMPVTASDLYPAPVHSDDLPVNVICSLSTEKTHNIRHISRLSYPACRYVINYHTNIFIRQLAVHFRVYHSAGYAVHPYTAYSNFPRQRLRKSYKPSLCR